MIYDKIVASGVAAILLKVNAIQLNMQNYFTWASGIKSPIYCDNRVLLGHPTERNLIKKHFATLIRQKFPEANALSGVATAGIGIGALAADTLQFPYSYVRSSAKAHGKQNQIEGHIGEAAKIVVVEDLISTGGSTLKAIEALQAEGHHVLGAIAVFTYGFQKSVTAFESVGLPFYTLSDYEHLIYHLEKENKLDAATKTKLLAWRTTPGQFD